MDIHSTVNASFISRRLFSRVRSNLLALVLGFGLFILSIGVVAARSATAPQWVDAWSAAADQGGPSLRSQTIRQTVRTSVGGTRVRIRLSNLFGAAPITIGPVHVAMHSSGASIQAGSDHRVTFSAMSTVTIAKGGSVVSDPVTMDVAALQELAISLYLPKRIPVSTIHGFGLDSAFLKVGADATGLINLPSAKVADSRFFLTDVEVECNTAARVIVAVGDSITDGVGSTPDANKRWPDLLASRLHADPAFASIAVINAGIAGNRILHDGVEPFVGPGAVSRIGRDAIDKPGAYWIMLLEGIGDIGAASMLHTPEANVSAEQIIDGMKSLIARAHQKGIKIMGATLLPYADTQPFGTTGPFYSSDGDATRLAVNAWIREAGAFDAFVDFDQVTRDPARPDHLLPEYDSGDHLHPNDAGYRAMAEAIDLHLFMRTE